MRRSRLNHNKYDARSHLIRNANHLLPAIAVALCGAMWGGFLVPLRWFEIEGIGGGWVSLIFNAVAALSPLPWLMHRKDWEGFGGQA